MHLRKPFFNYTKEVVVETKNNSLMSASHLHTAEGAEYEQLWESIKYFLSLLVRSGRQNILEHCGCGLGCEDSMCSLVKFTEI